MGPVGVLGVKACESGEVGTRLGLVLASKGESARGSLGVVGLRVRGSGHAAVNAACLNGKA